ncbi:MAG: hypothetical protein HFG28_12770 [Eubacterium sp.]|nr:hypothetical protein [Eubacterium sp.]
MGFFKKLPHKATPTELEEINVKLTGEVQGLTQEWALDSLGVERLLPLINIADNEKLGTTKAILYAYRFGYLAKEPKISNPTNERYYNLIMQALESTEDTSVFSGAYSYIEGMLSVRKGGTYGKE